MIDIQVGLPPACKNYKRPKGVMGGPCLNCGRTQPEHVHRTKELLSVTPRKMQPIPIAAAERIAKDYNYDQVVIIARKVGERGGEHVTTYGRDKANCVIAAQIGDFLKHKVMGWPKEN